MVRTVTELCCGVCCGCAALWGVLCRSVLWGVLWLCCEAYCVVGRAVVRAVLYGVLWACCGRALLWGVRSCVLWPCCVVGCAVAWPCHIKFVHYARGSSQGPPFNAIPTIVQCSIQLLRLGKFRIN